MLSHTLIRHCEECSDAAIHKGLLDQCAGLPRCARNDGRIEWTSAFLKSWSRSEAIPDNKSTKN